MSRSLESPDVSQRSLLSVRVSDPNDSKPFDVVARDGEEAPMTAFGWQEAEFRDMLQKITGDGTPPFLKDEQVTRALNTGFDKEFRKSKVTGKKYDTPYGPLSTLVDDVVKDLEKLVNESNKNTSIEAAASPVEILLWMLKDRDNNKDTSARASHGRLHLCELIVFLAQTVSQLHHHPDYRLYKQDLVVFLLQNVFLLSSSKNDSVLKYDRLLTALGLRPTDKADKDGFLFKTNAKISIVKHIFRDNSMTRFITRHEGKKRAFSTPIQPADFDDPKILPEIAQVPRLAALWPTDDVGDEDEETDRDKIVAHFTRQVLGVETNTPTQETGVRLTDDDRAEMQSTFLDLAAAVRNMGETTWDTTKGMRDYFLDPRYQAVMKSETTYVPVNDPPLPSFRPVTPTLSMEGSVSPATIEPVASEHQEGITVTEDGIRHMVQHLYAICNDEGFEHLKVLENPNESIREDWRSEELDNGMDPHVGGRKWNIEQFQIMNIIGGEGYSRLLELRHDPFRICGKLEFLSVYNFRYFCDVLIQSTPVKHRNVARVLGYCAIPFLGDPSKPICMCILREKGLQDLRTKISEHSSLEGLEKLRSTCIILIDVLSALEELEKADIMHRDIKPENIVLFSDGLWKVVDFGIAHTENRRATTEKYLPSSRGSDEKHDSFSVGIVMYELMCGKYPQAKAPSDRELKHAFMILDGIDKAAAEKALEVCRGLTLPSLGERWTAKEALKNIRKVMEALPK